MSRNGRIDVDNLRIKIEALLRDYPELANDEFLRADMLEGETGMVEVMTAIHRTLSDAMALRDGTRGRLEELISRIDRFQKRIDFCRDLVASIMSSADLRKVELPEVTVSMRQGQPPLIGEGDPGTLPDELVKITRTPNRAKIREALERGVEVPGYVIGNPPPHLHIRVK